MISASELRLEFGHRVDRGVDRAPERRLDFTQTRYHVFGPRGSGAGVLDEHRCESAWDNVAKLEI